MAMKEQYTKEIVPKLMEQFSYKNINAVPTIQKITLNVGLGKGLKDAKYIEAAESTLRRISGQAPVKTKARKSISGFKIREGMQIGSSVTLRGEKMYDFLYRMINITLPRVRDFRGISPKSFDGQGNYTLGFKENIAFPEVNVEGSDKIHGLQVVVSTTAQNDTDGRALLTKMGFPFKKK